MQRNFGTFFLPKMLFSQLSLISAFLVLKASTTKENTTLLLIQTIFRHSDRAPLSLYPTDPNSEDCWPDGMGRLTQTGKKQHYEVGKYLRSMYKDFVTSNPSEIYVNSSSDDRCLNSAEANLASFYAPEGRWKLADDLKWQPIPIHYLPTQLDKTNYDRWCPRADLEMFRQLKSPEVQQIFQTHENMVKEVSNYSGLDLSQDINAFFLFDTLEIERSHHLTIPEWALPYWDEMRFIAYDVVFPTFYSSPVQLRLRAGPSLEIISENLKNKINGHTPDLKVVINSDHDVNVAGILQALNFTNMPRPPYCATLIFELHEMTDASMAVRLLYLNSTDPLTDMGEPHVLVLDGCSEFCPVEDFIQGYQWLIPDNWEEECQINNSEKSR